MSSEVTGSWKKPGSIWLHPVTAGHVIYTLSTTTEEEKEQDR